MKLIDQAKVQFDDLYKRDQGKYSHYIDALIGILAGGALTYTLLRIKGGRRGGWRGDRGKGDGDEHGDEHGHGDRLKNGDKNGHTRDATNTEWEVSSHYIYDEALIVQYCLCSVTYLASLIQHCLSSIAFSQCFLKAKYMHSITLNHSPLTSPSHTHTTTTTDTINTLTTDSPISKK